MVGEGTLMVLDRHPVSIEHMRFRHDAAGTEAGIRFRVEADVQLNLSSVAREGGSQEGPGMRSFGHWPP